METEGDEPPLPGRVQQPQAAERDVHVAVVVAEQIKELGVVSLRAVCTDGLHPALQEGREDIGATLRLAADCAR